MDSVRSGCKIVLNTVFEYKTPRLVTIRSFTAGVLNRLIQLLIIAYIIGYVIIYQKGYQTKASGQSSVTTKVKGIVSTLNHTKWDTQYRKVWDTADYVIPAQMDDAVFVMTNAIITPRQNQSTCSEEPSVNNGTMCHPNKINSNCIPGAATKNGNGIMTGHCVPYLYNKTIHTCEVEAWCPIENPEPKHFKENIPLLSGAESFTLLIKNFVYFPAFGTQYKRRNIFDAINNASYLKSCLHSEENPYCPVFKIGYIIKQTGNTFSDVATKGAIISVSIKWDCDLDFNIEHCKPTYSFSRLDTVNATLAPGWNFRFSKEYRMENGTLHRDLWKAYGLLFVFNVETKGGKFDAIPLVLAIGSGLALLGIAVVLCDIVVLYLSKSKEIYNEKKFLTVVDERFAEVLGESNSHENLFAVDSQSLPPQR